LRVAGTRITEPREIGVEIAGPDDHTARLIAPPAGARQQEPTVLVEQLAMDPVIEHRVAVVHRAFVAAVGEPPRDARAGRAEHDVLRVVELESLDAVAARAERLRVTSEVVLPPRVRLGVRE